MKVTISEHLCKVLVEKQASTGLLYPTTYIGLNLRDGVIDISPLFHGGVHGVDRYYKTTQTFPISSYAHGPALLSKLEQLLPALQKYKDLFNLRWDGSNMRYFLREGIHSSFLEQKFNHIVSQLADIPEVDIRTPEWPTPRSFLRGNHHRRSEGPCRSDER